MGGISRRRFFGTVGSFSAAIGLLGGGWYSSIQAEAGSQAKAKSLGSLLGQREKELEETRGILFKVRSEIDETKKKWIIYGGGTNLKYMPDPTTKQLAVPLEEIWAFDRNFAFCRVDNNPKAFIMPTYSKGPVIIEANSFYMVMETTHMAIDSITNTPSGGAKVTLKGDLDCVTEASSAGVKIGDRHHTDSADFEIEAVDDKSGDKFAFTTFFDKEKARVEYEIFGPKFTFTGSLKTGDVVIKRLADI